MTARLAHVELIKAGEKLSPDLGGTGYLPPAQAATLEELSAAVRRGEVIWKVARSSVNWARPAKTRRLQLSEVQVACRVIGSVREWWLVMVVD